jgi:hypothetical protein
MKPNRDAAALAASLSSAAAAPLPLPEKIHVAANSSVAPAEKTAAPLPPKKSGRAKPAPDTTGITLRPSCELLNRYTMAAAERTFKEGKVISAQQIMIEVLERGLRGKS